MAVAAKFHNIFSKVKNKFSAKKSDVPGTALDELLASVKFINALAYIVGLELKTDWRFSNRTLIAVLAIASSSWLACYTLYMVYPTLTCVELLGGSALILTSATKFVGAVLNHRNFVSVLTFVVKLYGKNLTGARSLILLETNAKISHHCKLILVGMAFGLSLYSCYPCYDFLFNGNLTLISPLLLPMVDEKTLSGYLTLTVMNVIFASYAIFGTYVYSCVFLLYVDVYDAMSSLLENDFKSFDWMWEKQNYGIGNARSIAFRNIMMELMDLARFNEYMNNLFGVCATVQIVSCFYGIVAVLFGYLAVKFEAKKLLEYAVKFVIFQNSYISGIGSCVYFITELMMFCYIGQQLLNTNERIVSIMYNSEWYNYETKYQRDMCFPLNIFNTIRPIRIGNMYPLNFETGLKVVNNIYSMLIFMLNILD